MLRTGNWARDIAQLPLFVTRPISLGLLVIGAVMLALMLLPAIRRSREVAFQE